MNKIIEESLQLDSIPELRSALNTISERTDEDAEEAKMWMFSRIQTIKYFNQFTDVR